MACLLRSLCALLLVALYVSPENVRAQSTGRLTGVVKSSTGKPLTADVMILETRQGQQAGDDGRYVIDGILPGTYTVKFHMISHIDFEAKAVLIEAGQTQTIDATLEEDIAAEIDVIDITASKFKEKLHKDKSASIQVIDSKEVRKIRAIVNTEEAIAAQKGVTLLGDQFFVRGGRSGETKTLVEGMPVSDSFAGSDVGTLDIALTSQEGISFLSGGFDAEYGNAQSGIIEIATKEGGETYSGQLTFLTDDFGAPDKTYFNYDQVAFGFGGPVPFAGDSWRFHLSGEGVFQDSYLKTLEQRSSRKLTYNGTELASLRDRQENAMRGDAKLTYRFSGSKKLSAEYLFSRNEDDWYHHAFSRIGYWSEAAEHWWFEPLDSTYTYYNGPAHNSERESRNDQYKLVYTQPLTDDSFLNARIALFRTRYKESVRDKSPEQYVSFTNNDSERDPQNLFFVITGDYPVWERRESNQYTLRVDYENKIGSSAGGDASSAHEMKAGLTFDYFDLFRDRREYPDEDDPDGAFPNRYNQEATGGVLYVQDKLRYKRSMVINAGLRFDFFDPGEDIIRVSNQRVLALQKPTEGTSFFERWKAQVSPRLGMSFPISERDVLHFHYGRFFQLPDLRRFYDYANNPAPGSRIVGNAFLEPETTISYEFGLRRQLSDLVFVDATVFFKDIFGLVGTKDLEAEDEREQNQFAPITYFNEDYGSVRGFEVSLDKKFSSYWQGGLSYTLSRATGSSSDVNQGATVVQEGQDRKPIREIPLDWDRTHVLNAHLYFSDPGIWGVNFDLAVGTGAPVTPLRLGQRDVRAEELNTLRLPHTMTLKLRANKQYTLYGQEFRLFLEGRNVLDRQNVRDHYPDIGPLPDHEYYREYYTEFGELGGAYNLADTIGTPEDILIPLNDPRVYGEPRVFRFGIQFEW